MSAAPRERFEVCAVAGFSPGDRRIIEVAGRSIGIFNVDGKFYALKNVCPHEGAGLCRGTITGMNEPSEVGEYRWVREGEIIRCPWHGWEFDITTGKSIFNPHKVRVKQFEVRVEPCGAETESGEESEGDEEPFVEEFPVHVENEMVVVYV